MSIKSFILVTSFLLVFSGSHNIALGVSLDEEVEMLDSRNQMGPILFDQEQAPHLSMKQIESRLEPTAQKMRDFLDPTNSKLKELLDPSNVKEESNLTSRFLIDDITALALATKAGFSSKADNKEIDTVHITKMFSDELLLEQIEHSLDTMTQTSSLTTPVVLDYFLDDMNVMLLFGKAGFTSPLTKITDTGFMDQTFLGKLGEALEKAAQSIESTNPYAPYYAWGP
jgi:hypothetical protein